MYRFLIVDDDELCRRVVKSAVRKECREAELTEAYDGRGGYLAFEEGNFDCIVTDMQMPTLDGRQFASLIRAKDKNVPIVLYTSGKYVDREKRFSTVLHKDEPEKLREWVRKWKGRLDAEAYGEDQPCGFS